MQIRGDGAVEQGSQARRAAGEHLRIPAPQEPVAGIGIPVPGIEVEPGHRGGAEAGHQGGVTEGLPLPHQVGQGQPVRVR